MKKELPLISQRFPGQGPSDHQLSLAATANQRLYFAVAPNFRTQTKSSYFEAPAFLDKKKTQIPPSVLIMQSAGYLWDFSVLHHQFYYHSSP